MDCKYAYAFIPLPGSQTSTPGQAGSTSAPTGMSLEHLSLENARAIPLGSLPVLDSQGNVLAAYNVTAADGSGTQPSLEDLSAVVQHAVNAGTVLSLPPVHMDELPGEGPKYGSRAAASAGGAASTAESRSRATSVASSSQASRNRRAGTPGTSSTGRGDADPSEKRKSKYIGVSYYPRRKKWKAQISLNRRNHFLGYYPTEDIAGAVVAKAKELKDADWAVQHIIQGVKDYYKSELSAAPARPAHPAAIPAGAGNKRSRDDGMSAAMGTPIIAGAGLISDPPTSA